MQGGTVEEREDVFEQYTGLMISVSDLRHDRRAGIPLENLDTVSGRFEDCESLLHNFAQVSLIAQLAIWEDVLTWTVGRRLK